MSSLRHSLQPLLYKGTPREWLATMSNVLASDAWSNTWSSAQGAACRVLFSFPNGLTLTWLGDGDGNEPALLQMWVAEGHDDWYPPGRHDTEPMPCPIPGEDGWWDPLTQTWCIDADADVVADTLAYAVRAFGPPTVLLPWDDFIVTEPVETLLYEVDESTTMWELATSEDADEVIENIMMEVAEDEDPTVYLVWAAASRNEIVTPAAWGSNPPKISAGDDWMPPYSPNVMFWNFIEAMEDKPNYVVIRDECCGTCAGGSYRSILEGRGLPEGSPSVIVYGQNAQYYWRPSGEVDVTLYQRDDSAEEVAQVARDAGLRVAVLEDGAVNIS